MKKSIIISEADNIAALTENDRVVEFFVNRGELLLGDIYVAIVENILPGIDAAFVNLGKDKMGFLHANDIPGEGALRDRLVPKQKLLVQITKEPTGHKGPRVSTAISLPGRFLVLVPEERGISISRRISESKERSRLKSVVTLMKPPGVGVIIRTEAKGQNEASLFEDFEQLWDRWQSIVSEGEASIGPKLVYRDQDLLYRVIRDAYSTDVTEIIVDTADGQRRAAEFMSGWAGRTTKVLHHVGDDPLLISKGIDKDIELVLSDRADLPSGGHLNIEPTEALTVIDVNSGRFTSSRTQAETVRKTNLEAAQEIPRQLRLRNIGGMVIVDFIDMESRRDQQQVLEMFNRSLEDDRAKPQVGQLSDLGLVELTRRRQGQSIRELFAEVCTHCSGTGAVPTLTLGSGEFKRVITLPNKEEEAAKKNAGKRGVAVRGGAASQLRAVSATGGRIQPTVSRAEAAEEDFGDDSEVTEEIDVPAEILEQMPEELLAELPGEIDTAYGSRAKYPHSDEHDDEDDEPRSPSTSTPPSSGYKSSYNNPYNKAPYKSAYSPSTDDDDDEDDDDDDEDDDVAVVMPEELSMVEVIPAELAYPIASHTAVVVEAEADEDEDEEEDEDEDEEDEVPVVVAQTAAPLPESDFETEVDPVTGIYRLKPKDKIEGPSAEEALQEDAAHSRETYFQSGEESGEHYGAHEHGSHEQCSHEHGTHEHGSHEHGSHEQCSHEHGSHEHGSHEHGSHEQCSHEHGSHEQCSHEHGSHEHGSHEHGSHEHGSHEEQHESSESNDSSNDSSNSGNESQNTESHEQQVEAHQVHHWGHNQS